MKVYLSPDYANAPPSADNGGIRRVVEAQAEHLPKFGIEVVHNPNEADVICNHGAMLTEVPGVPSVNVCHGLYWSRQNWGDGFQEVNAAVVESMRHAVAHTAPSEWVARAIRRGGFWYPEVVYHGIDGDKFLPSETHADYILWNKARADFVSDPGDMQRVAEFLPNRKFLSTLGRQTENVKVLMGNPREVIPHGEMKKLIANAGVYLATARETFGIGTLEALAYGVPVAGWDWGGQSEIIRPGETGYLAFPGDYDALAQAIEKCLQERERLSANCIADVRERWRWETRIQQYADIFERVHARNGKQKKAPKVSVIVTACKLDAYLPKCLESIQKQTMRDFECLVIDDAQLESTRMIVREFARRDKRFKYRPTPNNFGLVGARNFGMSLSRGGYIRHVDADDFLAGNCLEIESEALNGERGIDIVYGHLEVTDEDGARRMQHGEPVRGGWPPEKFDWAQQMAHLNQIPSCAMARREVYERSGGYRERMRRNEDAEFWCRVTSLGFRAKKVTQAVTYFHRERGDSKGAVEWKTEGKEPDWTSWFPWRMGAADYNQAREIIRKNGGQVPDATLVPFGAQGKPAGRKFWYVHDYAYPVVSIIVTCGPGHKHYLIDALDSIQAQTFPDWECFVVNDTGAEWDKHIAGAPWAKVVSTGGNKGAAAARNAAYPLTRGRYIVWLDADDYWLPWFLEKLVGMAQANGGVIFPDLFMRTDEKTFKVYQYGEFDCVKVPFSFRYPGTSVLIPREITEAVLAAQGGWDEQCPGMEDWDYAVAIHNLGFCAYHLPEPLFVYRTYSSTKREKDHAAIAKIRAYMDEKWARYRKEGIVMACGCASKKPAVKVKPLTSSGNFQSQPQNVDISSEQNQMILVEYTGQLKEPFTIRSRVSPGVTYRFEYGKPRNVFRQDADYLMGLVDAGGNPNYRLAQSGIPQGVQDPGGFLGTAAQ